MTAEQMFSKFGYDKYKIKEGIHYQNSDILEYNIKFLFDYKYVSCWTFDYDVGTKSAMAIDMGSLKAIIQQCRELGWLEND